MCDQQSTQIYSKNTLLCIAVKIQFNHIDKSISNWFPSNPATNITAICCFKLHLHTYMNAGVPIETQINFSEASPFYFLATTNSQNSISNKSISLIDLIINWTSQYSSPLIRTSFCFQSITSLFATKFNPIRTKKKKKEQPFAFFFFTTMHTFKKS